MALVIEGGIFREQRDMKIVGIVIARTLVGAVILATAPFWGPIVVAYLIGWLLLDKWAGK